MTWLTLLVVILADLVVAVGDVCARRWAPAGGMNRYLMAAVVCYLAVSSLWLVLLRQVGELGRAGIIWAATGALVPILLGRFAFGESTPWNLWLAMVMCAGGLMLASVRV